MAKIRRSICLYCIHLFDQPLNRVCDVTMPHSKCLAQLILTVRHRWLRNSSHLMEPSVKNGEN